VEERLPDRHIVLGRGEGQLLIFQKIEQAGQRLVHVRALAGQARVRHGANAIEIRVVQRIDTRKAVGRPAALLAQALIRPPTEVRPLRFLGITQSASSTL
jgi:hypothetical protein